MGRNSRKSEWVSLHIRVYVYAEVGWGRCQRYRGAGQSPRCASQTHVRPWGLAFSLSLSLNHTHIRKPFLYQPPPLSPLASLQPSLALPHRNPIRVRELQATQEVALIRGTP